MAIQKWPVVILYIYLYIYIYIFLYTVLPDTIS